MRTIVFWDIENINQKYWLNVNSILEDNNIEYVVACNKNALNTYMETIFQLEDIEIKEVPNKKNAADHYYIDILKSKYLKDNSEFFLISNDRELINSFTNLLKDKNLTILSTDNTLVNSIQLLNNDDFYLNTDRFKQFEEDISYKIPEHLITCEDNLDEEIKKIIDDYMITNKIKFCSFEEALEMAECDIARGIKSFPYGLVMHIMNNQNKMIDIVVMTICKIAFIKKINKIRENNNSKQFRKLYTKLFKEFYKKSSYLVAGLDDLLKYNFMLNLLNTDYEIKNKRVSKYLNDFSSLIKKDTRYIPTKRSGDINFHLKQLLDKRLITKREFKSVEVIEGRLNFKYKNKTYIKKIENLLSSEYENHFKEQKKELYSFEVVEFPYSPNMFGGIWDTFVYNCDEGIDKTIYSFETKNNSFLIQKEEYLTNGLFINYFDLNNKKESYSHLLPLNQFEM